MRKNGNVVLIAPREELALKEKQQLESALQIAQLEPLISESFQLNYIKASDLQNLITTNRQQQFGAGAGQTATTGGQGSILSQRGVAMVDPRSNILFVQDTAAVLEEVRKIIRQIDFSIRQVLIEARIVIASDDFSQQLGVRFGQQTGFTFSKGKYAGGSSGSLNTQPVVTCNARRLQARNAHADAVRTRLRTSRRRATRTRRSSTSTCPCPIRPGQLALTLINLGSGNLINLELSALEADARGKVISSPRVVTADNQKAAIEQGTEIPYVTPGSANSPATVSFKKAVLRLEVTPQITPDNRIIMVVEIRKDSVGQYVQLGGGFSVPSIDTKNVDHADPRQQRRHRGDRRHLRGGNPQRRHPGAVPGQPADPGLPVQADGHVVQEDRTADLPYAAHRQGIGQLGAVNAPHGDAPRVALPSLAPVPLHRGNLFLVGLPGAGKSTLGRQLARRLNKRFVDADTELENRLGVSIPTIFEIEGEAGFRDREEATLADLTQLVGCRAVHRRRRRAASGQPRAAEGKRHGHLSARRPVGTLGARPPQPEPPAAADHRIRATASPRSTTNATRSIAKWRIT